MRSRLMLANPAARRRAIAVKDIGAAVHAAGRLQFGVVERLRAQADAIDAGGEPGGGLLGRDGFGIGLQRDLGRRSSRARAASTELGAHGFENAGEVGGIEEAGRAAAEIDGVDFFRPKKRRDVHGFFRLDNPKTWLLVRIGTAGGGEAGGGVQGAPIADFAFDGAGVRRIGGGRGDSGVKITVGALGLAERHLNVNSERLWIASSHYGLSHRLESDQHGEVHTPQFSRSVDSRGF